MMEERMDAQELMNRAGDVLAELKKSDAYPAVIGGIAGGLAGALMAVIIAGRAPSRPVEKTVAAQPQAPAQASSGFSFRDLSQLITVLVPLVKQVQVWLKEKDK